MINNTPQSTLNGFSLIEAMIVLSLMLIILAFALPNFSLWSAEAKQRIVLNTLLEAINLAQAEAAARNTYVALYLLDYATPMLVLGLKPQQLSEKIARDALLHSWKLPKHAGNIYWRSFPKYRAYLLFSVQGSLDQDNASFWYCAPGSTQLRWLVILNKTGRTRIIERKLITEAQLQEFQCRGKGAYLY